MRSCDVISGSVMSGDDKSLCELRLPRERQPRPQRRPRAPQLLQEGVCTAPATPTRLCVLRLPRERQPRPQRRPRALQLCAQKAAAAPAATTRAAAPPGGPVYCACHEKGSRGLSSEHARRSSSRRLCVLRLPREWQPGSSLHCACLSE